MNVHPFGTGCLFTGGKGNPICAAPIEYVWTMSHKDDMTTAVLEIALLGSVQQMPFRVGGSCKEHAAHVRSVGQEPEIVHFAIRSFRDTDTEDTVGDWAIEQFAQFLGTDPKVPSPIEKVAGSDLDSAESTGSDW